MLRLKRWPILLLDETLAAVSDDYVDQTGRFLEKLATTTGIPILLVTHKQTYTDHATVAYSGTEVSGAGNERQIQIQRLRGAAT
jgi:ABC-type molybdate transport system ATPase subunit